MPVLPADVVYQISTSLITETRTLKAISRTCRVWNHAVRRLIFRRVTITDIDSFERLRKVVEEEPFVLAWIFEVFVSGRKESFGIPSWFSRFPEAFPASMLPKLSAVGFVDLNEAFDATEVEWDYSMLAQTLPKLLQYVSVVALDFLDCNLPYDVLNGIAGAFINVADLHLHRVRCSPPDHLSRLHRLPLPQNLQSFKLHSGVQGRHLEVHVTHYQRPLTPVTRAMRSLKTLHYHFGADQWLAGGVGKILYDTVPHELEHLMLACPFIYISHEEFCPECECRSSSQSFKPVTSLAF